MSNIWRAVRCDRAEYALRYFGAVVVGLSLTLGWAEAASEGDKAKSERAESKAERAASKAERAKSEAERVESKAERAASKAERVESRAERGETSAAEKDTPKKRAAQNPTSDTDACRREAQGMHGPERGRFMTDCLKKRD